MRSAGVSPSSCASQANSSWGECRRPATAAEEHVLRSLDWARRTRCPVMGSRTSKASRGNRSRQYRRGPQPSAVGYYRFSEGFEPADLTTDEGVLESWVSTKMPRRRDSTAKGVGGYVLVTRVGMQLRTAARKEFPNPSDRSDRYGGLAQSGSFASEPETVALTVHHSAFAIASQQRPSIVCTETPHQVADVMRIV